ncbi:hypothetical protein [Actinokineospora terrae]|uniref:Uncharacterized protein n=1 Tax=Actinokineospora terrae TaxID=155974 RepID=A0A1H9PHS0_9PSEU|nr:hypothetical protein [Actinokineospora terrae]SER47113.1 hypothetical protein SAMN04487818_103438 [Actinokineospora terrae]
MRSRHLPLSLWLRHPVVAANATFLARGTENGELAHEVRGLGRAGRLVHRRSRRLGRWSKRACSAAAASTAHRASALAAADTTRVLGFSYHTTAARGWAISATEARPLLAATLRTIDEEVSAGVTTHHQSRSRLITAIAYLLLAVDAVALFTVVALLLNLDWAAPQPAPMATAVAFSLFGAGVQAKLAVELGRRAWTRRVGGGEGVVITWTAVLLLVVSGCAAVSILLRLRHEGDLVDQTSVATAIGLVLAGCTLAAPWIIVQQETFDGSPLTRRAATLTRVITRADAEHHRHLRQAHRHLTRARRLTARVHHEHDRALARAARYYLPAHRTILLSRSLAGPSPDHPLSPTAPGTGLPIRLPVDRTPLTTPLDQARAAVAEAEALAGQGLRATMA